MKGRDPPTKPWWFPPTPPSEMTRSHLSPFDLIYSVTAVLGLPLSRQGIQSLRLAFDSCACAFDVMPSPLSSAQRFPRKK